MTAKAPGKAGASLRAVVDLDTVTGSDFDDLKKAVGFDGTIAATDLFNLTITDDSTGSSERFLNLTLKPSPREVSDVLKHDSNLVTPGDAPFAGDVSAWHTLAATLRTKLDDLETLEDTGTTAATAAIPAKIDEVIAAQQALDAKTVDPITALANQAVLADRKLQAVRRHRGTTTPR